MGLSRSSVGRSAAGGVLDIQRRTPEERVVALAGNPNVGKSTVFNALTGMNQHTGNWPGKTVTNAQGRCRSPRHDYVLVDIPGTYSLMAHSAEEEVARDFVCFGQPDAVAVVCDATCLERNLNLVLQAMELCPRVVVCVNLLDEARHKGLSLDLPLLSDRLKVPVVGTVAQDASTLGALLSALDDTVDGRWTAAPYVCRYCEPLETAIAQLEPLVRARCGERINPRWLSLQLLQSDPVLLERAEAFLGQELRTDPELGAAVEAARAELAEQDIGQEKLADQIVTALVEAAKELCRGVVCTAPARRPSIDRRLDRILTGRVSAYPVMLALLAGIFWLTIVGANYPSALLSSGLFWVQDRLTELFTLLGAPAWLHGLLVLGMYRVLAWVVSVMLPPMAIFFPLFTLLEDAGYLPRIAYNLDRPFRCCRACGKQALTMCMGFGCNAAGVVGCRIIDSPRERLLAILTNAFVPCNGRFPTLITLLSMFFIGAAGSPGASALSALALTALIALSVLVTLGVTRLLSVTLLRGVPSSFTLELPPYRRPRVGRVLVRSMLDRTLFVLGRAAAVAAPAGMLLWVLANVQAGDLSLLDHLAAWLDPLARLMGLDGVILLAFILGFPANEIVLPIVVMIYTAQGTLMDLGSMDSMRALFVANGWTVVTAGSTLLFTLMHWPCSTTLWTIHKETGSLRWTVLAAALPTAVGAAACILFTACAHALGL